MQSAWKEGFLLTAPGTPGLPTRWDFSPGQRLLLALWAQSACLLACALEPVDSRLLPEACRRCGFLNARAELPAAPATSSLPPAPHFHPPLLLFSLGSAVAGGGGPQRPKEQGRRVAPRVPLQFSAESSLGPPCVASGTFLCPG